MAELNSNEEPHVLPSKRKQTATDADVESTKKHQVESCAVKDASAAAEEKVINDNGEEEEEEEEDYDGEDDVDSEDEEDDDDEDEDEVEHSNGGAEIDRKGKGIMKDDKGKGKLIEESEEDDSSDDDGASESDGDDDDLSDDPLAEVDLDNILPSRTRRRTAPPGLRISNDKFSNDKDNDA
ncbi:unnamed protein product [Lactuca virosa]|uniref:Histone chaperone domain-containing protein n=1 Tax=Lactuca virosa TaxID=75947 RepID=A0AAU9NIZ3_9ASTR|nr:unnamed protein product [Lactuca virosa]